MKYPMIHRSNREEEYVESIKFLTLFFHTDLLYHSLWWRVESDIENLCTLFRRIMAEESPLEGWKHMIYFLLVHRKSLTDVIEKEVIDTCMYL